MLAIARSKLQTTDAAVLNVIPVDYKTMTWQDLYQHLAKAVVEHFEPLVILDYVKTKFSEDDNNDTADDSEPRLPSWVPDFSRSMSITSIHYRAHLSDPFSIWANISIPTRKPFVQGSKLFLHGIKIDKIRPLPEMPQVMQQARTLAHLKLCTYAESKHKLSSQIEVLISTVTTRNIQRPVPGVDCDILKKSFFGFVRYEIGIKLWELQIADKDDHDGLLDEVRKTLRLFPYKTERGELPTMDMLLEVRDRKAASEDRNNLESQRHIATAGLLELEQAAVVFSKSMEEYRALFLTEGSGLGLGPVSYEPDDEVWAIAGADVPFVLRPVESDDGSKTFRLLGDCYLHECMHGEMIEDDPDIVQKLEPIVLV